MRSLARFLGLFLALTPALSSALTVNRLNGGGNVIYIDFSLPGTSVPLELIRSYNSITAVNEGTGWDGAFGWGWTAPFETTLTTTPERNVLLRDGTTGNTVTFRASKEKPGDRKEFFAALKRAYFERQKNKKLTDAELAKLQLPEAMSTKLRNDAGYRKELATKFGLPGEVPTEGVLTSSEYGYETIQLKGNQWVREKSGITQFFDREGRLIKQVDKNGYFFEYRYNPKQPQQIASITSQDQTLALKFRWAESRIADVVDNQGRKSVYAYDKSGNLTRVTDSNNQTYVYKYENKGLPHLLTQIDYPNEADPKKTTSREIRYDKQGLVVFHKDRDGSETTFSYGKGSTDPENNFWTKSIKRLPSGANEEQYDEYFLKARPDGSKFLAKQINRQSGVETVTVYTPCCGKPQQIVTNGKVTNFKYYPDGLLMEKSGPKEEIKLEYDPRWKKVTKVTQNDFISEYGYDDRGNLVKASNSRNEKVTLTYDRSGRISQMVDSQGKVITFKYGSNGKPAQIAQKGVGTIRISYDGGGQIVRTETVDEGRKPTAAKSQEIIQRVMKGFQQLLDIIRPAGVSFAAL